MTWVVEQTTAGKISASFGPEREASTAEASAVVMRTDGFSAFASWTRSPQGPVCRFKKVPLQFTCDRAFTVHIWRSCSADVVRAQLKQPVQNLESRIFEMAEELDFIWFCVHFRLFPGQAADRGHTKREYQLLWSKLFGWIQDLFVATAWLANVTLMFAEVHHEAELPGREARWNIFKLALKSVAGFLIFDCVHLFH